MPTQRPLSPYLYQGPYWGLNTSEPSRGLHPGYAEEATNILLDEGAIMVRPPFKQVLPQGGVGNDEIDVTSIFEWWPDIDPSNDSGLQPRYVLRQYGKRIVTESDVELSNAGPELPAAWITANGRLFIVGHNGETAPDDVIVVRGIDARLAGLKPLPTFRRMKNRNPEGSEAGWRATITTWTGVVEDRYNDTLPYPSLDIAPTEQELTENTPIGNWRGAEYEFALTLVNKDEGVESNMVISPERLNMSTYVRRTDGTIQNINPSEQSLTIQITLGIGLLGGVHGDRNFSHVRCYIRRTDISEPFYLAGEYHINDLSFQFSPASIGDLVPQYKFNNLDAGDPNYDEDNPYWYSDTLGNTVTGPFGPTKNAPPYQWRLAYYYKDRMFYTTQDHPDRLYYSAIGQPEHTDPDDYETLDDAGGRITGMAELSGQLVIFKEKSIWILSGIIIAGDNATNATGAPVDPSPHELYKTKSHVGCNNTLSANGVIVAGLPSRIYFVSASGFYSFDGLEPVLLSGNIDPTWDQFAGKLQGLELGVTYAADARREIIYIANHANRNSSSELLAQIWRGVALAYHYGLKNRDPRGMGAWTVLRPDDYDRTYDTISCVGSITAPAVSEFGFDDVKNRYAGAMFGVSSIYTIDSGTGQPVGDDENNGGRVFRFADNEPYDNAITGSTDFPSLPNPVARYRTGKLTYLDGLQPHYYLLKLLHEQAESGPVGDLNFLKPAQRLIYAAVLIPTKLRNKRSPSTSSWTSTRALPTGDPARQDFLIDLARGIVSTRPIRRSAQWIQLEFHTEDLTSDAKWHRTAKILGWKIDLESAGQR